MNNLYLYECRIINGSLICFATMFNFHHLSRAPNGCFRRLHQIIPVFRQLFIQTTGETPLEWIWITDYWFQEIKFNRVRPSAFFFSLWREFDRLEPRISTKHNKIYSWYMNMVANHHFDYFRHHFVAWKQIQLRAHWDHILCLRARCITEYLHISIFVSVRGKTKNRWIQIMIFFNCIILVFMCNFQQLLSSWTQNKCSFEWDFQSRFS